MIPVTPKNIHFETPTGVTFRSWLLDRQGFVQKKPYNLLLPLTYVQRRGDISGNASWGAVNGTGYTVIQTKAWGLENPNHDQYIAPYRNYALQDCKKRLAAAVGERGALLVTLVEYRQAMKMMENRLLQLYRFARHMSRFEFGSAANAILSRHDKDGWERFRSSVNQGRFKRGSKNVASNYLEFHYGWMPAIGDLTIAAQKLSGNGDKSDGRVESSGSYGFSRTFYDGSISCTHKGVYRIKAGCTVKLVNPNLFLANQMGLVNPYLAVADVIKYSFLVDYLFNLSEFCAQFTDFAGLNVADQWYREYLEDRATWIWPGVTTGSTSSTSVKRTIGVLPTLKFQLRKPWQLSARRGAALASLAVNAMPDDPRSLRKSRPFTFAEKQKYVRLGKLGNEYFR